MPAASDPSSAFNAALDAAYSFLMRLRGSKAAALQAFEERQNEILAACSAAIQGSSVGSLGVQEDLEGRLAAIFE